MMMELLNNFDCGNSNKEISLSSTYNNEQTLYRSCLTGDLERVQYLLRSNSSSTIDLNRQNSDGLTLLHFACSNNFYGLVQLLLQYNATNHIRDHLGRTCLHYASIKGYRAIINLLLQSIESCNQHEFIYLTDDQTKTSLDYACENDHIDLVEIFLKYTNINQIDLTTSLYNSCIEGHLDICHLLISKQQEKKDCFYLQSSLIQSICHRGHIEILRLLIENFSISTQQRDCGNSILFYCITTFDIDLVRKLLERQTRLNEKDIHDLITFCPLNDDNRFYIDHYFDCLELLLRYRLNFDDQKICKYFIRELCEKCTTIMIGKKLKYLFALAIYTGSIQLYRRSTIKWCGEINILTKRYVNLIDVIKQTTKNWSLKHLLRLKIKRSMKIFNIEQIKKLPGLQEHHMEFLSFEYL
jgi:ankyrin repeat protein